MCLELLKRRRLAMKTQSQLAELAGVNKETIVRLERGQFRRGPDSLTMARIAGALQAPVEAVFPELMRVDQAVA